MTSPNGGPVTITEAPTNDLPPSGSGYAFLGRQLDIEAPDATTADPLILAFTIDAEVLTSVDPDLTAYTVMLFRNGTPVPECTSDTTDPLATPDPCVSLRDPLAGTLPPRRPRSPPRHLRPRQHPHRLLQLPSIGNGQGPRRRLCERPAREEKKKEG